MSSHTPNPAPRISRPWFLRRTDQLTVAVLVLLALAAISGWPNKLAEADQVEQRITRFQVDINSADIPELIQLPGIGETLAQRIVETRQSRGPYTELDELRRVRGIGPKIMERLRPYLLPVKKTEK